MIVEIMKGVFLPLQPKNNMQTNALHSIDILKNYIEYMIINCVRWVVLYKCLLNHAAGVDRVVGLANREKAKKRRLKQIPLVRYALDPEVVTVEVKSVSKLAAEVEAPAEVNRNERLKQEMQTVDSRYSSAKLCRW